MSNKPNGVAGARESRTAKPPPLPSDARICAALGALIDQEAANNDQLHGINEALCEIAKIAAENQKMLGRMEKKLRSTASNSTWCALAALVVIVAAAFSFVAALGIFSAAG